MYKNNILIIIIGFIALIGLFISFSDYLYIPGLEIYDSNLAIKKLDKKLQVTNNSVLGIKDLQSNTWIWKSTEIDGVTITPKKADAFTITFNKDNTISGSTDCNGFGGEVMLGDNGALSFGPFMGTLMFCEGSQEVEFTQTIANANRYIFNNNGELILLIGNSNGRVVFNKK